MKVSEGMIKDKNKDFTKYDLTQFLEKRLMDYERK